MRKTKYNIKRKIKKSYLVIGDGETEVWYFQMMKKNENLKNVSIEPKLPIKKELGKLFNEAEKASKDYDKVILLIDFDTIVKGKKYLINLKRIMIKSKRIKE